MTASEVKAWVVKRYGPIHTDSVGGVCVAGVPLYGAKLAVGMGSDPAAAVCDLYLDLHGWDARADVPPPETAWEEARRANRARTRPGRNPMWTPTRSP